MKHKYNYFYKITNLVNGHFYYGVHSTDNLDDGYMGSGTRLKRAIKKYGIENFKKEILAQCNNRDEAYEMESSMVTESLIKDDNCYNIILGGKQFTTEHLISVKDNEGNYLLVHNKDPRYLNGELVGVNKGKFTAIDDDGNVFLADTKSDNVHGINYGKVTVKDKSGNFFLVDKNDERYLNGELTYVWKGKKHSAETKEKLKNTLKKIGHQKGEKNSQFGTCWVTKCGENKKIKKDVLEEYIKDGWKKGRTIINSGM